MSQRLPGECLKHLASADDGRRYSLALCESIGMGLGSQLVTQIRNNPIEAITPTVILDATKYIHLKDGALRIIGA